MPRFIDVLSRRSPGRAGLDKARPDRVVLESSTALAGYVNNTRFV
jgi:hypothetical protein